MKNWVISQLDTKPQEGNLLDVVSCVHWRRQAEEVIDGKTYASDTYGSMSCAAPSEIDFTAYSDLTEAQVHAWLEASMNVEHLDAYLDAQIEIQVNPIIVNLPLPWAPIPVVPEVTPAEVVPDETIAG